RAGPGGRQPVRRMAKLGISEPAHAHDLRAAAVHPSNARAWPQSIPWPLRQHVASLYQSARVPAWPLLLLRVLREIRLRQLFKGIGADDDPACFDAEAKFYA